MRRVIVVAALVVGLTQAAMAQTAPNGPPTMDEMQQMFDAKQYQPLLPKLIRALAIKGPSATYDRYKLWMMKGETHLNLKQWLPASEAFAWAAKEAASKEDASLAKATAVLAKKSRDAGYLPHTRAKGGPAPQPIPVLDPDQRKAAFAALLADELALNEKKIEKALSEEPIKPVMDLIPVAADLMCIERAATGGDAQTRGMVQQLTNRVVQAFTGELTKLSAQIKSIQADANTFEDFGNGDYGKRGLDSPQKQKLNIAIATAQQIQAAADVMAKMPVEDTKPYALIKENAERVIRDAGIVIRADYGE